ncbi:MAG: 2Fe-2S iron-sulfur cluster-binding protein [Cyanobacteria bacterium P01_D01_bin.123]
MADILERIHNPVLRAATSALMGASAATILTSGILALTDIDDGRVHRLAVLSGGVGVVLGAAFGVAGVQTIASDRLKSARTKEESQELGWKGWRSFVVKRKVRESEEITSFYLEPEDGLALPGFVPGQFLTIKLDIPGQKRPTIRTYSLSDFDENPKYYRLSIKREGAPKGQDVPPGVGSNFMHDRVEEGTVIPAKPPAGKFVLDLQSDRPAILISNGVGITPMVSMAKAVSATNPERPVWFLHGARNGPFHAFREGMVELAERTQNLTVHYRYSRPTVEDEGAYHSKGYVDVELVKACVGDAFPPGDADYFLCGSPAFMDSLRSGLTEWNVPKERVFFEAFSKPRPAKVTEKEAATGDIDQAEIVFAQSGQTATWTAKDGTLLEFAEEQGIEPDHSCRAGICLTCACRVEEGEVAYDEPPGGTPDEGLVLICVSKPKTSRVVLDL